MAGASPATRRAMERNKEADSQREEVRLPEPRQYSSQPEEDPIRSARMPNPSADKSMRTPIPMEQAAPVNVGQTYHQPATTQYVQQVQQPVSTAVRIPPANATDRYFTQADVTKSGTVVTEDQIYNAENRRMAQAAHTAADMDINRSAVDTAHAELAVTHMNSQRRTVPLLNGVNTAMQVVGAGAAMYNTIQAVTNGGYNYAHINNYQQQPQWGVRAGGLGNIVNIVTGGGSQGNYGNYNGNGGWFR